MWNQYHVLQTMECLLLQHSLTNAAKSTLARKPEVLWVTWGEDRMSRIRLNYMDGTASEGLLRFNRWSNHGPEKLAALPEDTQRQKPDFIKRNSQFLVQGSFLGTAEKEMGRLGREGWINLRLDSLAIWGLWYSLVPLGHLNQNFN